MDKKYKNLILISLFRTFFVLMGCYCYIQYDVLKTALNKENPIEYSIKLVKKRHSGGSYCGLMQIEYNEKEYEVEISRTNLANLKNNKEIPILHYEEEKDIVFSEYQVNAFRNGAIVLGSLLLVTLIPFGKISGSVINYLNKRVSL